MLLCLSGVFEFRERLFSKHRIDYSLVDKAFITVKKCEVFLLLPFILDVCVSYALNLFFI